MGMAAAGPALPPLRDLQAELAALAPRRAVLLLLVSRHDCQFCAEVRSNYLAPLQREGPPRLVLRELESDTVAGLIDASGKHRPTADVLKQLGVRFFPTVLFLGSGVRTLAEPLLGLDQAGFYGAYLDSRLQQALSSADVSPKDPQ